MIHQCEKCHESDVHLQHVILAELYHASLCNSCINAWSKAHRASRAYEAWDQTYLMARVFALDATAGKATPHDLVRQVAAERKTALDAVFAFAEEWMAEPLAKKVEVRDE